jgi:hypothetical protein
MPYRHAPNIGLIFTTVIPYFVSKRKKVLRKHYLLLKGNMLKLDFVGGTGIFIKTVLRKGFLNSTC